MKVEIIAAGKIKHTWLINGINEYTKRISKYLNVNIIEVSDASDKLPEDKAKKQESEQIMAKIDMNSYKVALDVAGKELDSVELAEKVPKWLEEGGSKLTILIAGSRGFSDDLLNACDYRFSMSKLTFPHQMARLIFLEQLYRTCKINRNERYHK